MADIPFSVADDGTITFAFEAGAEIDVRRDGAALPLVVLRYPERRPVARRVDLASEPDRRGLAASLNGSGEGAERDLGLVARAVAKLDHARLSDAAPSINPYPRAPDLPPVPPFPVEVFPQPLRLYLERAA
ncbi:MAG: hypothetical protein M3Q10_07065, partial [Chloroflexota bacterium]|nr:hypothetical protein [Chloroflexota bacterium]